MKAARIRSRLPHHRSPKEFVSIDKLSEVGVLHWKLNEKNYENDNESKKIREARGYSYMDLLDLCPDKVENYEQKLKNLYTEPIHADEEIRSRIYRLMKSFIFAANEVVHWGAGVDTLQSSTPC